MKLTKEFILENSQWSPEVTQQILQDHEDAKKWDKTFTELARNFDIDDIDWNGGDIDFKTFFGKLEKYRQIVKRLEERKKELDEIAQNCFDIEGKNDSFSETIIEELQKILEGKK